MDSSWYIEWHGIRFIVDPWLTGSEIDGAKWINEQWHQISPVEISEVPEADFILITQSYADHCHLETLDLLDDSIPILATTKAYNLLRKKLPNRVLKLIPDDNYLQPGNDGLSLTSFRPRKLLDPIYYSVVLKYHNEVIFIAQHGFKLSEHQKELLADTKVKLLVTTFTDFRLPQILGGHVNPGLENVEYLVDLLKPDYVVNSHDEDKKMSGLVARFGKVTYPKLEEIGFANTQFLLVSDYASHKI